MTKISPNKEKPIARVSTGSDATKITIKTKKHDSGCMCFWKVASFLILVFGCTAGYLYRYNVLSSYILFRNGYQFAIGQKAGDFSTTLCQQYEIKLGEKADVFLVDGGARIDVKDRIITSLTENEYINQRTYSYYASYLLQGSYIQVKGCRIINTISNADILVIKGDDDWESWKKGECPECAKKSVNIKERDRCDFHETFDLEYEVMSADNFYVVTTQTKKSPRHSDTFVFTRLTLIKTVYDLTRIREMCIQKSYCNLNLSYASDQDIIVNFHQDPRELGRYVFTSTNCHLRIMFWAGIFGILPASLIILLTMCCCFCNALEKKGDQKLKKAEIKHALVSNHHSVNSMNPPYYESVSDPLPSYDSVA